MTKKHDDILARIEEASLFLDSETMFWRIQPLDLLSRRDVPGELAFSRNATGPAIAH